MCCTLVLLALLIPLSFLLRPFLVYFVFRPFLSKRRDLKKAGEWAIVTGSTDGIGKAFAELLAKEGLNIFLISRSIDKLQTVAAELEKDYKVKTKIFAADLAKESFSYDQLQSEIEALSSISCLINNAGLAYAYPDAFANSPLVTLSFCQDLITINVTALSKLTRIILPKMLNDPPPTHGVHRYIINMGSLSGVVHTPYFTVYSASKAYVSSFTKALAVELKNTCVRTQVFAPSSIVTKMTGIKHASFFVPSSEAYAKSALSMIGVETEGCGYLSHDLLRHYARFVPSCIFNHFLAKMMLKRRERHLQQKTD